MADRSTTRGKIAHLLLDGAHAAGVAIMVLSATFASNIAQLELTAGVLGLISSSTHPNSHLVL